MLARRIPNSIIDGFTTLQLCTMKARHAIPTMRSDKRRPRRNDICRRHPQMRLLFFEGGFFNFDSFQSPLEFLLNSPIEVRHYWSWLRRLTGGKPLHEPMMTQFAYAQWIYTSLGRCVLLSNEYPLPFLYWIRVNRNIMLCLFRNKCSSYYAGNLSISLGVLSATLSLTGKHRTFLSHQSYMHSLTHWPVLLSS